MHSLSSLSPPFRSTTNGIHLPKGNRKQQTSRPCRQAEAAIPAGASPWYTQTHHEEAASCSDFPVSMCMSYGVAASSPLGWWIHAVRCSDQPGHRNMGPPTELPLHPPPLRPSTEISTFQQAGAFDVFYVPLVYVNMNKRSVQPRLLLTVGQFSAVVLSSNL